MTKRKEWDEKVREKDEVTHVTKFACEWSERK